jgi:predicted HTH transcriptional regulator
MESARTNLRNLKNKKLIKRVGADKNGYWKVLIK